MKRTGCLALMLGLLLSCCMAGPGVQAARAEEMRPRYALRAVNLGFEVDAAQFQREIERYNAAISRFEGAAPLAAPPKAADPDGRIRQTLDDLAAQEQPFILSMDGRRLFTLQRGVPIVYHLDKGRVTLLAPDDTMSQAYYGEQYKEKLEPESSMFRKFNDGGLVWSTDGAYLLMSFIDDVLGLHRFGSNTLLADVRKGTIRPIDEDLPPVASQGNDPYVGGYPIRACFHESEPIAYVEYFGVEEPEGLVNQIRAHHLDTGRTDLLGEYPSDDTTWDPSLWFTRLGVAHSFYKYRNTPVQQAGIAFHSLTGETRLYLRESQGTERLGYSPMLISVAGAQAMIYQQSIDSVLDYPGNPIQLISLDRLDPEDLRLALLLQPFESPDKHLSKVPFLQSDMAAQGIQRRDLMTEDFRFPSNAVLSPDGRYALLAVRKYYPAKTIGVYLYDIARHELSAVALPDLQPMEHGAYAFFGSYQGPDQSPIRGIR